jgi:hypothetical protein
MGKKTFIISLCLGALLAFSIIAWKSSYAQTTINITEVDSIVIRAYRTADTIGRKLTATQSKQFAEDWNRAKSVGPCKYASTHRLTVYMKDGTKRGFRANGKTIKENNDYGFKMKKQDYFEKLWEGAR